MNKSTAPILRGGQHCFSLTRAVQASSILSPATMTSSKPGSHKRIKSDKERLEETRG